MFRIAVVTTEFVVIVGDVVLEVVFIVILHSSERSLSVPGTVQLNFAIIISSMNLEIKIAIKSNKLTICDEVLVSFSYSFEEKTPCP